MNELAKWIKKNKGCVLYYHDSVEWCLYTKKDYKKLKKLQDSEDFDGADEINPIWEGHDEGYGTDMLKEALCQLAGMELDCA